MHVALCKLITLDLKNFLIKQLLPPSVQKVANLIFYDNMYGTPLCSVCVFVINVIKTRLIMMRSKPNYVEFVLL